MLLFYGIAIFLLSFGSVSAEAATGPIYTAIDHLFDYYQIKGVPRLKTHHRVALTKISTAGIQDEGIDETEIQEYITKRYTASVVQDSSTQVIHCRRCIVPQAVYESGSLVVKKGDTSLEQLRETAQRLKADVISQVNVHYTGTRLAMQVSHLHPDTGHTTFSGHYHTRLVGVQDNATRFSFTLGQLLSRELQGFPTMAEIFWAERVFGIGSMGINLMGVVSDGEFRDYVALGPKISLNLNELFAAPWTFGELLIHSRINYGFYGNHHKDVMFGFGTKLIFGSIYHMDLSYFVGTPMSPEDSEKDFSESLKGLPIKNNAFPTSFSFGFGIELG